MASLKTRLVPYLLFAAMSLSPTRAQTPEATLSQYFEGKQVLVKMDMPATQRGVDIRPGKPQPLDTKSYADRLKQFGVALHNGESVLVTKVKVKSDSIEFQLGGGGYGTAGDTTDESVHFTPADKSDREKELEEQLKNETDPDRRRSLTRELDNVRRDRERRDRRNQAAAERDADYRRDKIAASRAQGGSRFNIRLDKKMSGEALTPQMVMQVLSPYVAFSPETGNRADGDPPPPARSDFSGPPALPAPPSGGDPVAGLKKGLTRAQVEALFGLPTSSQAHTQGGLTVTTCNYQNAAQTLQADFVNDVLVQYKLASR